jgi:hypothetical protein
MLRYTETVGEEVEKMVSVTTKYGVYSQLVSGEFNIDCMMLKPSLYDLIPRMKAYLSWILARDNQLPYHEGGYKIEFEEYQAARITYGQITYNIEDIDRLTNTVVDGQFCDEILSPKVISILNSI